MNGNEGVGQKMKHIFIINPIAGKSDQSKQLIQEIESLNIAYQWIITEYPGHATDIVKDYAKQGEPIRVYACGGDGTLNEVIEGAYGYPQIEVGCYPCGTGNDFIRNFGDKALFSKVSALIQGESVAVDLLDTPNGISASICSVGFDANVGYNTVKFKRLPFCGGKMAYNIAVLKCLLEPISSKMRITIDDTVREGEYLLACMANGTTYGGGFKGAPEADVADGLADIVLVKKVSRLYIAKLISKYSKGLHIVDGQVIPELTSIMEFVRGKNVVVESEKHFIANRDGECGPYKKLELEVKPKAMRFIIPKVN